MQRPFVLLTASILISGCATVSNPMDGHTGAFITMSDTVRQAEPNKGEFFALTEVDGRPVKNALAESGAASFGKGNTLTAVYVQRLLPLRPMSVKLVGTHRTAMPIHEIASRAAGTFFEVSGVVRFEPKEGVAYEVIGTLTKQQSCVWIADVETKQVASPKVCTEKQPT